MAKIKIAILFILALKNPCALAQLSNTPYAQLPPGDSAVIFAPGMISDDLDNRDMAISPSGDELFYTLQYRKGIFSVIMHAKKVGDKWSKPDVASFSGQFHDLEPAFCPDGSKLYFASSRASTDELSKNYDIWFATKTNGEWGNPQQPGGHVNTTKNEFYPSVNKNGDIYFTREMDGKDEDIVVCRYLNGSYQSAVSLPDAINSNGAEFNAFIDPDEKFILFTGYKRKDSIGAGDLYISRKNENGEWTEAKNLGPGINGSGINYCPYVSPDKKYFFFSSSRTNIKTPFKIRQDFKALQKLIVSPLNGLDNIYWINAESVLK